MDQQCSTDYRLCKSTLPNKKAFLENLEPVSCNGVKFTKYVQSYAWTADTIASYCQRRNGKRVEVFASQLHEKHWRDTLEQTPLSARLVFTNSLINLLLLLRLTQLNMGAAKNCIFKGIRSCSLIQCDR